MSSGPAVANIPKPIEIGDEIILKGKIADDAKELSINFTINNEDKIAYHFKTYFHYNIVVLNNG